MEMKILEKKLDQYKLYINLIIGIALVCYFGSMLFMFQLSTYDVLVFLLFQVGLAVSGIAIIVVCRIPVYDITSMVVEPIYF